MARRKVRTTKLDIIKCGTTMFLEKGYSATSPRLICEELDISTGNLTQEETEANRAQLAQIILNYFRK